jgi:hypothetical protein
MRAPLVALVGVSVCCALLSGCKAPGIDPPSSSPSSGSSESGAPSDEAAAVVELPTDCVDTMSEEVYASTFAEVPLNDPAFGPSGVLEPDPAAPGSDIQQVIAGQMTLICIWRDPAADVTGLRLAMGHVEIEDGEAYLENLDDEGYDCEDRYDGQWCQHISNDTDFGVEEGHTAFLRDDVFIEVRQANFPTNGFLADVVETTWND